LIASSASVKSLFITGENLLDESGTGFQLIRTVTTVLQLMTLCQGRVFLI